jgi:hypothetical protein
LVAITPVMGAMPGEITTKLLHVNPAGHDCVVVVPSTNRPKLRASALVSVADQPNARMNMNKRFIF